MIIEACVDSFPSALAAQRGGADRIELCADLADAGTTPSSGTIACTLERLTIPVFPIIRARGGGFVYDADEIEVMRRDVIQARALGVQGVVIGALTADGRVDAEAVAQWLEAARGLPVTFHRAIDVCRDAAEALETLIRLGVTRVLTSGGHATAWEGRATIAALHRQGGGRITILAGGAVDEHNAAELVRATGVTELHVRGTRPVHERAAWHDTPVPFRKNLPDDNGVRSVTDPERLRAIRHAAEGAV